LRIGESRFCLFDFRGKPGNLFGADSGIDVIAVGLRGGKRGARLRHRRGQLLRGEFGDDVARMNARALLDFDGGELAANLGRDAGLGRPHDADDGRSCFAVPQDVSPRPCRQDDQTERDKTCGLSHGPVSA